MIFDDIGSGKSGVENVIKNLSKINNISIHCFNSFEIKNINLSNYHLIVFSGGSASKQAHTLGEENKIKIKEFVSRGGNYLGICAGAYLASSGFEWSLGLVNVETKSKKEWNRGKGEVRIIFSDEGMKFFKPMKNELNLRYSNGPIFKPVEGISEVKGCLANYLSEISQNGVQEGVMLNTPAIIHSKFHKGNVFVIGPHPEDSKGSEFILEGIIRFLMS